MERDLSYPSLLLCLVVAKLPVLVAQRELLCRELEEEEGHLEGGQGETVGGQQSSGEENSDFEHIDNDLHEPENKNKVL